MNGLPVCRIIDSSCVDGPGNRSVVFLQGCNFNCTYCHNPETIDICDACNTVCPASSSPKVQYLRLEHIAQHIEANLPFIRGVTFSGGECMLHANQLAPLCERLSKTVGSVLLDSNGSVDFSRHRDLLAACDGIMLDVKCFDEEAHRVLTGHTNKQVLENAVYLAGMGKLAELRTVVVPEILPNEETIAKTAALVALYLPPGAVVPYKLIKFRAHGVRQVASAYQVPTQVYMETLKALLAPYDCFTPVII
jgi:pyruvate formate lyase activating enzyme